MRRAALAAVGLGMLIGGLFAFGPRWGLAVVWPAVVGAGLWEVAGRRGAHALATSVGALLGAGAGFAVFWAATEALPPSAASLGIAAGVGVAALVAIAFLSPARFPLAALLGGFAAYAGLAEGPWRQTPERLGVHGGEDLTVAALGLLAGILAAVVVRAAADRARGSAAPPDETRPSGSDAERAEPGRVP